MLAEDSCPTCALAKSSLAALAPIVAAEWHATKNAIKPAEIAADHVMNAWWTCPNGHEYQATIRARTQGNRRCPTCYGGWSLENIRAFVKSLVGHLDKLNPSELFALAMQAGVLKDKGKPFVMALTNGRFPVEELEKFANGQPSVVDKFAAGAVDPLTLELVDKAEGGLKAPAPIDPYALPAAPAAFLDALDAYVKGLSDADIQNSAATDLDLLRDRWSRISGEVGEDALARLEGEIALLGSTKLSGRGVRVLQWRATSDSRSISSRCALARQDQSLRMMADLFSGLTPQTSLKITNTERDLDGRRVGHVIELSHLVRSSGGHIGRDFHA